MTVITAFVILNAIFLYSVWLLPISGSLKIVLTVFLLAKLGLHFFSIHLLDRECGQSFILSLNLIVSAVLIIMACIIKLQNLQISIAFLAGMVVIAFMQDFMMICHLKTEKRGGE